MKQLLQAQPDGYLAATEDTSDLVRWPFTPGFVRHEHEHLQIVRRGNSVTQELGNVQGKA
jgi:hypothetical protein